MKLVSYIASKCTEQLSICYKILLIQVFNCDALFLFHEN